jgi:predicted transcriptional regulator
MTLTVRLDDTLESALTRYCAERGVTKSLVVQECLAKYLIDAPARAGRGGASRGSAEPTASATYRAFADAGLIGCVAGGGGADKATVRARIEQSFAQRKARRGGA